MKNKPYPMYEVPFVPDIRTMIDRQAELYPNEAGFQYSEKRTLLTKTHSDVKRETDALCAFIAKRGYLQNKIAIIGANSYNWLIAFFAVICSGNIAVPIDSQLTSEKIGSMLSEADCKAVFVTEKCRSKLSSVNDTEVFELDKLNEITLDNEHISAAFTEQSNEAVAAIFFTSGTTGSSKGVMLSQKNMMTNVWATRRYARIEGQVISVLPFHHAFGLVIGVLSVYCYGCPIYINQSLKRVLADFQLCKPKAVALVPLFVETFYKSIKQEAQKKNSWNKLNSGIRISELLLKAGIDRRRKMFKKVLNSFGGELEYIVCGGAAMDKFYLSFFRSIGIHIINGYGITECSPTISMTRNHYWRDGSAGLALDKSSIRTADDGEICVKSDSVMIGYYNREEETKEAVKDGWFFTGDLGHIDKDGFLWITGRKKNLIILSNGENISPEEIESVFCADEAIEEAIVYGNSGHLAIEIYPEQSIAADKDHFQKLIDGYNSEQPAYRQIAEMKLRSEPFVKNTSGKIIRNKTGE